MSNDGERIFEAHLIDQAAWLHVDDLCARLHVEQQWIVELVELGVLEPRGGADPSAWAFALADIPRVRTMARLVEDLGVNLPGAALVMELLEERRWLLAQLRQWREADRG